MPQKGSSKAGIFLRVFLLPTYNTLITICCSQIPSQMQENVGIVRQKAHNEYLSLVLPHKAVSYERQTEMRKSYLGMAVLRLYIVEALGYTAEYEKVIWASF